MQDAQAEIQRWLRDIESGAVEAQDSEKSFRDALLARRPVTPQEAAQNRAELDKLIKQYGKLEAGEKPARPVILPKKTIEDLSTSKFVRTVAEAPQTPDWMVAEIERGVAKGDAGYSYVVATDKAAMKKVKQYANRTVYYNLREWETIVRTGKGSGTFGMVSKNDIALGEFRRDMEAISLWL